LFEYVGGTLRSMNGILLAAGGMPDHVHLLVGMSQEQAVADVLREIKAGSSKWIHDTFRQLRQFAWQAGYGAFTVSHSGEDEVKAYIARPGGASPHADVSGRVHRVLEAPRNRI
jgi:putative transposase